MKTNFDIDMNYEKNVKFWKVPKIIVTCIHKLFDASFSTHYNFFKIIYVRVYIFCIGDSIRVLKTYVKISEDLQTHFSALHVSLFWKPYMH